MASSTSSFLHISIFHEQNRSIPFPCLELKSNQGKESNSHPEKILSKDENLYLRYSVLQHEKLKFEETTGSREAIKIKKTQNLSPAYGVG